MEFFVLGSPDDPRPHEWTLAAADQRAAAELHGYTAVRFTVDAPTRGYARAAWNAEQLRKPIRYEGRETDDDWGLESLSDAELDAVVRLVRALVDHDEPALEAAGAFEAESDPYLWTRDYGGRDVQLVVPPGDARHWDGAVLPDGDGSARAVVVEMWTAEHGPCDLSLEAELDALPDGTIIARFDDLHVM